MKGKSLLVAIFIVIGALTSFIIWQHGTLQQHEVENVGFFKKQQDNLVVQYGQQLLWISPDKQLIKQLNITDLGLRAVGDYGFFSNGDLLIYHRAQPLSLLDNIKSFLRVSSEVKVNTTLGAGHDGFYRCQLSHNQCNRFGYQLPLIGRGFRLHINPLDEMVYLADTSAHQLYKISNSGRVIAPQGDEQFAFPNHIEVIDNKLWLADTNHQRIVILDTKATSFAQLIDSIEIEENDEHQFPHQFALDGHNIWINIADQSMSNGIIQQYSRSGERLITADLQHANDPMTMVIWDDKLLVADFITAQIEQLNLQGESLGLLSVEPLQMELKNRQAQIEEGQLIAQYGQLCFTITLILGLFAAWKLEGKGRKTDQQNSSPYQASNASIDIPTREIQQSTHTDQESSVTAHTDKLNELGVMWLTNNAVKYKNKIYKTVLLIILPITSLFFGLNFGMELIEALLNVAIVYVIFMTVFIYLMNYLTKLKIGIDEERVHLYARGNSIVTEINALTLGSGYLFFENFVIPIGHGGLYLFDKTKLQEQLLAQLNDDNIIPDKQLNKRLWKLKEPLFVSALVMVFILFVVW